MTLKGLPTKCPCQQVFNPVHAINCKKGGFIHMRHDDLRDLEALLLSEVCKDVAIEPQLQPLTGEILSLFTANSEDIIWISKLDFSIGRPGQRSSM